VTLILSTYDCDDLHAAVAVLADFFCGVILPGLIAGDSYVDRQPILHTHISRRIEIVITFALGVRDVIC